MSGSPFSGPIDLVVRIDADESDCDKVVFSVELRIVDLPVDPTAAVSTARLPEPTQTVEIVVFDDCGDVQLESLEFANVGTKTVTVDLPSTECDKPGGDWGRTYHVVADPTNKVHETAEGNNRDELGVACVG
jgi:hypothetical protein